MSIKPAAIIAAELDSEDLVIRQFVLFIPFSGRIVAPKIEIIICNAGNRAYIKGCLCIIVEYDFDSRPNISLLQHSYHRWQSIAG
jgi:hypothetical protein